MNLLSEIEEIETEIEDAKSKKAEAEGAIKAFTKQLKETHGIKNLATAKKFIEKEYGEIDAEEVKIEEQFDKLKAKCGF